MTRVPAHGEVTLCASHLLAHLLHGDGEAYRHALLNLVGKQLFAIQPQRCAGQLELILQAIRIAKPPDITYCQLCYRRVEYRAMEVTGPEASLTLSPANGVWQQALTDFHKVRVEERGHTRTRNYAAYSQLAGRQRFQ